MTGVRANPAISQNSSRPYPPRSRQRLLLKAVSNGTTSRDAKSEDVWSVQSVSGTLNGSENEVASDNVSTEPLDYFAPAFRRVLRATQQTEAMDRPDCEAGTGTQGRTESLDYFTPAFRAVLREEAPTTKVVTDEDNEDDEGPASLEYFTPALP